MNTMEFPGARDDGRLPTLEGPGGAIVHAAQWFGYPACCHNYFWFDRTTLTGPHSQQELELGFLGTGYRPCPDCQQLSTAEIYRGICERRLSFLPFPVERTDFNNHGRMTRKYLEALQGFIERLQAKGIRPEDRLMELYVGQVTRPDFVPIREPRRPRHEGPGRPYKRRPFHVDFRNSSGVLEYSMAGKYRVEQDLSELLHYCVRHVKQGVGHLTPGLWSVRLYLAPNTRRGNCKPVQTTRFIEPSWTQVELTLPDVVDWDKVAATQTLIIEALQKLVERRPFGAAEAPVQLSDLIDPDLDCAATYPQHPEGSES